MPTGYVSSLADALNLVTMGAGVLGYVDHGGQRLTEAPRPAALLHIIITMAAPCLHNRRLAWLRPARTAGRRGCVTAEAREGGAR